MYCKSHITYCIASSLTPSPKWSQICGIEILGEGIVAYDNTYYTIASPNICRIATQKPYFKYIRGTAINTYYILHNSFPLQ